MSLIRYSNQLPSLFDRLFENDFFDWSNRNFSTTHTTLPAVNIRESNDEFHVELAAPGFDKSDFNIELHNDLLTISSEKKFEENSGEGDFTRREYSYQSFSRTFSLPNSIDSDKIAAHYDKGILKITIPKMEKSKPKPTRQINIS